MKVLILMCHLQAFHRFLFPCSAGQFCLHGGDRILMPNMLFHILLFCKSAHLLDTEVSRFSSSSLSKALLSGISSSWHLVTPAQAKNASHTIAD